MSKKLINILVGCLLGDAHIGRSLAGPFVTFEQSVLHENYIISLHAELKELGVELYDIKYYDRHDSRYNKQNRSIYFKSYPNDNLKYLADLFLDSEGKKVVPVNIRSLLGYESLAYWICDDGQLVKKGGITLCTDNYTEHGVFTLKEALENKFEIECTIHKKKGVGKIYHRIYIKMNSLEKIKPKLLMHIHESFKYKLHEN